MYILFFSVFTEYTYEPEGGWWGKGIRWPKEGQAGGPAVAGGPWTWFAWIGEKVWRAAGEMQTARGKLAQQGRHLEERGRQRPDSHPYPSSLNTYLTQGMFTCTTKRCLKAICHVISNKQQLPAREQMSLPVSPDSTCCLLASGAIQVPLWQM